MLSALIITKNEQRDLPGCLDSLAWCDDIHVFDSFSQDHTIEVARARGATVSQRVFDGYASQRNAALHTVKFRHPWTLVLDADERVPEPLARELMEFARSAPTRVAGARLRRRDFLYGTWLKHAAITPYYLRVLRPGRARYEREVNEIASVDGTVVSLNEPFDHYPFSKGFRHWIDKHNAYSSMEAQQAVAERRGEGRFSVRRALFDRDLPARRYHQKGLFYRLPGRPFVKFCYMMFSRRAFLDGRAGVTYAMLQSIYEYFIVLKERELRAASLETSSKTL